MRRIISLLVILFVFPLVVGAQSVRSDLLNRINTLRAEVGVHAYSLNPALNVAAQNHAEWMVATGLISHTQSDGSTPRTRAQNAGYDSQWVSENIYMGTNATAQTAFVWWTNSSIHYRGMTAGHYYDIGIGSASGNGQTAYVLVFGNPSTAVRVADPVKVQESDPFNFAGEGSTASGSSSVPVQREDPPPPSFVVGLDEWGNILHEVQPGHTMGDILFMYGYNWEDLDWVRTINGLTARESRWLDVGDVVKIPPYQGTYTPAPGTPEWSPPSTRTPSPEPSLPTLTPEPASATPQPSSTPTATLDPAITPSPTFTLLPPVEQIYLETTPEATEAIISPTAEPTERPAWVAATVTTSPTPAVVAQADPNAGAVIAPRTLEDTPTPADTGDSGPPGWLVAVIALQVGVLVGAGIEYWRRGRAG